MSSFLNINEDISLLFNKFINFKKLSLLGMFSIEITKELKNNVSYNYYISNGYYESFSISIEKLFKSVRRIYPLINSLYYNNNFFLFVNIEDGLNDSKYMAKIFLILLGSIDIYCTYDWGYGSLTNFGRIFTHFYLEDKEHFPEIPSVTIFLKIFEKQHYIIPDTQRVGALSIGLVDYRSSGCIDYPVPGNTSVEYTYFLFKILLLQIIYTNKKKVFMKNMEGLVINEKIAIKKSKWLAKITYRFDKIK
jgi:hypothetical protein